MPTPDEEIEAALADFQPAKAEAGTSAADAEIEAALADMPAPAQPEPPKPEPSALEKFAAVGKTMAGVGGAAPKMEGLGAAAASPGDDGILRSIASVFTDLPEPVEYERATGRGMSAPVMSRETQDAMAYTDAQSKAQEQLDEASSTPMGIDKAPIYRTAIQASPLAGVIYMGDALGLNPLTEERPMTAGDVAEGATAAASVPLTAGAGIAPTLAGRVGQSALYAGGPAAVMAAGESEAETPLEYGSDVGQAGAIGTGIGVAMTDALPALAAARGGIRRAVGRGAVRVKDAARARAEIDLGDEAAVAHELADPLSTEGARMRGQARAGQDPRRLESQQEEATEALTGLMSVSDDIRAQQNIAEKGRAIGQAIEREGVPYNEFAGDDIVAGIDDAIIMRRGAPRRGGDPASLNVDSADNAVLNRAQDAVQVYRNRMESVTDPGDHFLALDDLKRELQKLTETAYRSPKVSNDIAQQMEAEFQEPIRQLLQDPKVWGEEAAQIQQVQNAAWVQRLSGLKGAERALLTESGERSAQTAFRPKLQARREGTFPLVKGVAEPINADQVANARRLAETEAGLGEALTAHLDPDDPMVALAQSGRREAQRFGRVLDERAAEAEAADQLARIQQLASEGKPRGFERLPKIGGPLRELRGNPADRAMELARLEAAAMRRNPQAERDLAIKRRFAEQAERLQRMAGEPNAEIPYELLRALAAGRTAAATRRD